MRAAAVPPGSLAPPLHLSPPSRSSHLPHTTPDPPFRQVPVADNYFAALNAAVFSDGSFVYIPKGVRSPMELSTYFRINASETGQVGGAEGPGELLASTGAGARAGLCSRAAVRAPPACVLLPTLHPPPHPTPPFPASPQFERTLIVAEEGAYVSYLEGCTAPAYDENQLHAAVVELSAAKDAEIKYSTVQNWWGWGWGGWGACYTT